jgi:hypothetical protein
VNHASDPVDKIDISHSDFANLSSEILKGGKVLRFTAHGSSMVPFIFDGDVLTIQDVGSSMVAKGDIVFYRTQNDGLMAHRIIKVHSTDGKVRFSARGDGSPGSEEIIDADQVIGEVISIRRGRRTFPIKRGIWKILGYLWAHLHPVPYLTYRLLRKLRSSLGRSEHS